MAESWASSPKSPAGGGGASLVDSGADALSPHDFEAFRKLIRDAAGIHLSACKGPMLSNRLRRRLRQLRLSTYADYYTYLKQEGPESQEFFRFLEAVTTNETYFMRNRPLWDSLETHSLPMLAQGRRPGHPLVFWSAACSSGEEPYTLAMVLHRNRQVLSETRILASDISQQQLATARAAYYDSYAVSRMSVSERRQYFLQEGEGFRLREEYRRYVEFFFHNLRQPMQRCQVDCVILRNVLMYFDEAMQYQALCNVCASLRMGGLMIVGDVDPLHARVDLMSKLGVRYVRPWVYEKM